MKKVYLGIDAGSVSINFVIITQKNKILETLYLRNRGVLETLKEGFEKIDIKKYCIAGVGSTGSGKGLVDILINSDLSKVEITAHFKSAIYFYPDVNTIFEIGGEDSKLIIINNSILTDFAMNTMCSGGTGAMLDNLANRLNIKIEDFGKIALKSKNYISIPGKCSVFAVSTVVSKLNSGASKEDLLMGVCRALIRNYLTMLGLSKNLRPPYLFQGGTSENSALVRALEEQLNHKVIIPKYNLVMGAIGVAILVKEYMEANNLKTSFTGDIAEHEFVTKLWQCRDCPNNCEITNLYKDEKICSVSGSRCGKWTVDNVSEAIM